MLTLSRETTADVIPSLPTYARTVFAIEGTWAIARVRPRAEKELARDLAAEGFGYFLPLLKRVDDQRHTRYLPLPTLERYVFCASTGAIVDGYRVPTDLFYFLNDRPGVTVEPIAAGGQERFASDLAGIHARVNDKPNYDDWAKPFIASDRMYKIRSGAYRGFPARIDCEGKRGRVWVLIESMKRTIPLEVNVTDLEPA